MLRALAKFGVNRLLSSLERIKKSPDGRKDLATAENERNPRASECGYAECNSTAEPQGRQNPNPRPRNDSAEFERDEDDCEKSRKPDHFFPRWLRMYHIISNTPVKP